MKTPESVQGFRRASLADAMPGCKLAMPATRTLLLLSGWLALSYALHSFLGEQRERGDLTGGILLVYMKHWKEFTWLGVIWSAAVWGIGPLWG